MLLLGTALGALAFLIYLPGIGGPYLADDFSNLVNNPHLMLDTISWASLKEAATSSSASPFHRPLSMLTFALGYTAVGSMDPASAKLINILLHLCTGLLAFLLAKALLPDMRIIGIDRPRETDLTGMALLATGMWLLHPLFVSTVLYTVQRMSILSALFILAGCLFYTLRRPRAANARDVMVLIAGVAAFTVLAFLCKENGALLPGFVLLIELTRFRFAFAPGIGGRWRVALTALLVIPAALVLIYLGNMYVERGMLPGSGYYFSRHERLLTEFRVLAQYAGWMGLISLEPMGLYHDDFTLSTGLLQPPATAVALVFWMAALVTAAILVAKRHLIGFGILWFLWGHVLESTVIPLALVFEHRNYLPGFGLVFALACSLYGAMDRVRLAPLFRQALMVLVLLALPAWQLHERVMHWSDERAFIIHSMQSRPGSALTLLSAAVFLDSRGDPAGAQAALKQARENDPREPALIYAEMALHCEHESARAPDAGLAGRLLAAAANSPRTMTARRQFVEMAKVCAKSGAAADVLMEVYELRQEDRNDDVALISRFGIGAVHLHRGDQLSALIAWSTAMEKYPDGESLRPLVDELRRRMPTD